MSPSDKQALQVLVPYDLPIHRQLCHSDKTRRSALELEVGEASSARKLTLSGTSALPGLFSVLAMVR